METALSGVEASAAAPDHERRTWAVAAVNGLAMGVLVAGGLALNSAAVLAEGLHMSAHLAALAIGAGAYRLATRLRPCAARRLVDLAGLANALLLISVAIFLTVESLGDLQHPQPIDLRMAVGLAVFGLAVNLLSLRVLHRPRRKVAGRAQDLNFRAVYLHMAGDAVVGLISIAGLLLIRAFGWRWADGAAGLLGAALLAVLAVQIVSAALGIGRRRPRRRRPALRRAGFVSLEPTHPADGEHSHADNGGNRSDQGDRMPSRVVPAGARI